MDIESVIKLKERLRPCFILATQSLNIKQDCSILLQNFKTALTPARLWVYQENFYQYQELVKTDGLGGRTNPAKYLVLKTVLTTTQNTLSSLMQSIFLRMVSTAPVMNYVNAVYLFQAVASALFGCDTSLRISNKTPITAADLLNDKVFPFYTNHNLPMAAYLNGSRYWVWETNWKWKKYEPNFI